jgi:hypothetical protein
METNSMDLDLITVTPNTIIQISMVNEIRRDSISKNNNFLLDLFFTNSFLLDLVQPTISKNKIDIRRRKKS